jgi:hypothetical protein
MQKQKTFSFDFRQLNLTMESVGNMMGYDPGTIPDPFPALIKESLAITENLSAIQGGYQYFDKISFDAGEKILFLNSTDFHVKNIVFDQIKEAEDAVIFVCTAGPGIGEYSKRLMKSGDMMMGYIIDLIGSLVVEKAMDKIQEGMETEQLQRGMHITNRYSPGYCGWDVAEQHKVFALLPQNFCNIQLSETALMYPIKSISGIIGIGKNVEKNDYTCGLCEQSYCIFRNRRKQK